MRPRNKSHSSLSPVRVIVGFLIVLALVPHVLLYRQSLPVGDVSKFDVALPTNLQPLASIGSNPLLANYSSARFPVLSAQEMNTLPIKVGIVTIFPLVGEAMHFLYDGVQGSDYLQLVGVVSLFGLNDTTIDKPQVLKPSDAKVWIVDGARVTKLEREFLQQIIEADNPSWKVLFVDYTDRFQFQLRQYDKRNAWDQPHVRVAVRSVVEGRYYDRRSNSIVRGHIAPNIYTAGGPMLHCPYSVRSDTVGMVQKLLGVTSNSTEALERALFETTHQRPLDVVHMWNILEKPGQSKLRNSVSILVQSWNSSLKVGGRTVSTSVTEQGERQTVGRNSVDSSYVQTLLSSKIVIVTQKDEWEDHYRLFESLTCGPLVLADEMWSVPNGLADRKNIVFYRDLQSLQELVVHYLTNEEERRNIAREGLKLALNYHRSWHRMEELLFGRSLTKTRV